MRVHQLAKSFRISPDTIRYYTRIGLLSPTKSRENGYRHYGSKELRRLRFILSARHIGFSVKDIDAILRESEKGASSCPMVRQLFEVRLKETERQFQETLALRNRMNAAVLEWNLKPDLEPTSEMICHLIEDFSLSYQEENTKWK